MNHIGYLRTGKLPSKYVQQVQGCMWITGRAWWDFLSYHPDYPSLLVRVERDDEFINKLATFASELVTIVETETNSIKEKM